MSTAVRIAAWSGPRNISTAMMRAFENRPDTAVADEPFYAAWLAWSGADHPMRAEVLAAQPTDWRGVVHSLLGPVPGGRSVFYQKHMTHHVTPDMDLAWMGACRNIFLIRSPEEVVASYRERRSEVTLDDIGVVQQAELFEREADRLGRAPPVIDAADVLADPRGALTALCEAVGIAFDAAMLTWPPGPRETDGVWAPAWYESVWASSGFAPPRRPTAPSSLDSALRVVAEAARPIYERLARYRLGVGA
jgi:Sulfotransferase domain